MLKILKIALLLPIVFMLISCNKKDESETTPREYWYDPRIPFGNISFNNTKIKDVTNLRADTSILNEITLRWNIPPLYTTMPHKVMIYKRRDPPEGFTIACPNDPNQTTSLCPQDEANGAAFYLYQELEASEFRDWNWTDDNGDELNNIDIATKYSYWVFMKVNDNDFSNGVRLDVVSKAKEGNFQLPPPAKFWEYKQWTYGYDASPGFGGHLMHTLYSMSPGIPSPNEIKGGIAMAYSGNMMYVADTDNNRVLVYARSGALACEGYTDEYEKSACLLQYAGSPLVVQNVLGQETNDGVLPCHGVIENNNAGTGNRDGICDSGEVCIYNNLPFNECLTRPSTVNVIGNRLFISDSGNNRIVVYNQLPINGCITNNGTGILTPRECTPNRVIGKAGLLDENEYPVSTHGNASLDNPTGVTGRDNDIYIADTGNNRILKIENFGSTSSFNCTTGTWTPGGYPTSLCQFTKVLGQRDFFYKKTLDDFLTEQPNIILQDGLKDTVHPDYVFLFKRYFARPNKIVFNEDGKMLIGSNEMLTRPNAIGGKSGLFGRIMIYNENPLDDNSSCNLASFDLGECDADDKIGQEDWGRLFTIGGLGDATAYNQLSSGFYSLNDFDLVKVPLDNSEYNEMIVGVNSTNNQVYFWDNWANNNLPGKPKTNVANNPNGAVNPMTGQMMPILENICSVKVSLDSTAVYISDCGSRKPECITSPSTAGSCKVGRVYQIQAADYIINLNP